MYTLRNDFRLFMSPGGSSSRCMWLLMMHRSDTSVYCRCTRGDIASRVLASYCNIFLTFKHKFKTAYYKVTQHQLYHLLANEGDNVERIQTEYEKMQWPSLSLILIKIFLVYTAYCIYDMYPLFVTPFCEANKPCLTSYLNQKPRLQLKIYSSVNKHATDTQFNFVYSAENFNYTHANSL